MQKRGQLSIEYVSLIAFISIMLVPAIYYLYSSVENVKEDYGMVKIDAYGKEITSNSKAVYYSGLYSKVTLTPNMDNEKFLLSRVFASKVSNGTNERFYFVVEANFSESAEVFVFPSEVPLTTDDCITSIDAEFHQECADAAYSCTICRLDRDKFLWAPFKIETILTGDELVVHLST